MLETDFYTIPIYCETAVLRCVHGFLPDVFLGPETAILSWGQGGQLHCGTELRELYLCRFPTCSYFPPTHPLPCRAPRCLPFLRPSGVLQFLLLHFFCLLSQQPLVLLLHLYNSVLPSAPCSYTLLLF